MNRICFADPLHFSDIATRSLSHGNEILQHVSRRNGITLDYQVEDVTIIKLEQTALDP